MGAPIDYRTPIVADADAGHGGLTAVFKLTKMFIERGAAGIHMEDQTSTNKKCGHMAGRCVIPVQEHVNRLVTIRMCADIMHSDLIVVARTDSEAATFISSTIDTRDHYFIVGATNPNIEPFAEVLNDAIMSGASGQELADIEQKWCRDAGLKLFHEAVIDEIERSALSNKQELIKKFTSKVGPLTETSHREAKKLAKEILGHEIFFDWELPRVARVVPLQRWDAMFYHEGPCICSIC